MITPPPLILTDRQILLLLKDAGSAVDVNASKEQLQDVLDYVIGTLDFWAAQPTNEDADDE